MARIYEQGPQGVAREGKSWETWDGRLSDGVIYFPRMVETFLKSMGWSYEEFYEQYRKASESHDKRDFALMKGRIITFIEEIQRTTIPGRDRVYSRGTARNFLIAIRSFIDANELPEMRLARAERKRLSAAGSAGEKDNFTKDELRTLVESTTNLRNKALVYVGKDTGLRISDIEQLTVGHVLQAIQNDDKFLMLDLIQKKTRRRATPYMGPEALQAIEKWLRWRREKGFDMALDSPLFLQLEINPGEPLDSKAMTMILLRMIKTAGLTGKKLSAHCLRVYHQSQLEAGGVNKNQIYRLQGRLIPDSGQAYSKGELLENYKKAYSYLALDSNIDELRSLRKENDDLRLRLDMIEARLNELRPQVIEGLREIDSLES